MGADTFPHLSDGQSVTVVTDHAAVRAVLETANLSCKHAHWWMKVYGTGLKDVKILHRAGRLNSNADALSHSPHGGAPTQVESQGEVQVWNLQSAAITNSGPETRGNLVISELLKNPSVPTQSKDFDVEQQKYPEIVEVIKFLRSADLPSDDSRASRIALQKPLFLLKGDMLFYIDPKQKHWKRIVVPQHLRYPGVHQKLSAMCSCLRRAKTSSTAAPHSCKSTFSNSEVDIMELPKTDKGNKYVLVFQDFLTKWPLAFPMPDHKSLHIAKLLVNEVIPVFGIPESLLSDRGANLLSHLMYDVCSLLGITTTNTTPHHPQCDGMVEHFNRTLKTMLWKHATTFGSQCDRYLPGALWAYRNVPHDATNEKTYFLLRGMDCHTPTEAALLRPQEIEPVEVSDYREEIILSLSTARKLAAESIRTAQAQYKRMYDKSSREADY